MSSKKRRAVIDLTEGDDSETDILVKIKKEGASKTEVHVKEEIDSDTEIRVEEEDDFETESRVKEEDSSETGSKIELVAGVPSHLVKMNSLVEEFKCASWESPQKSKTMIKKMQKELKKLRKTYESV